jgi:hypothetical protein
VLFVGDDWAEEHHDVEVQGQAEQVVIGIETDRGPWEQPLLAAGYRVWAINPLQVARYRERHSVSGAKSDPTAAHTLADMVRTDRHQLRPIAGTARFPRRSTKSCSVCCCRCAMRSSRSSRRRRDAVS